jgi:hypothetical protein
MKLKGVDAIFIGKLQSVDNCDFSAIHKINFFFSFIRMCSQEDIVITYKFSLRWVQTNRKTEDKTKTLLYHMLIFPQLFPFPPADWQAYGTLPHAYKAVAVSLMSFTVLELSIDRVGVTHCQHMVM